MSTKPIRYRITAENVKYFRLRMKYWQEKFNLRDWRITVCRARHNGHEWNVQVDDEGFSWVDRTAKYEISTHRHGYAVTNGWLDKLACHEMMHLLLHPLKVQVAAYAEEEAGIDHEDCVSAEHAIINPVLNLLIPSDDPHKEL